jgi:hypothetical protein
MCAVNDDGLFSGTNGSDLLLTIWMASNEHGLTYHVMCLIKENIVYLSIP